MGCEWNRGQLLEDVGFEGKEAVAGGWTAVGGRVLPETWGRSRCCSRGGLLSRGAALRAIVALVGCFPTFSFHGGGVHL